MNSLCHCCGCTPDIHDTVPRWCAVCRKMCVVLSETRVLRDATCPFVLGRPRPGTQLRRVLDKSPVEHLGETFVWRGRKRHHVPGG